MRLVAVFQDMECKLLIDDLDKWEGKLLGAIAKGGEELMATVKYSTQGHFSNGNCQSVSITLSAKNQQVG